MELGGHIHIGRDKSGRLFVARCMRCGQLLAGAAQVAALLPAARLHLCKIKTGGERRVEQTHRSTEDIRTEARELRSRAQHVRRQVRERREQMLEEVKQRARTKKKESGGAGDKPKRRPSRGNGKQE
ncbi:MAG: hypothetical protein ACR2IF_02505 [Terriglobales bacterium]